MSEFFRFRIFAISFLFIASLTSPLSRCRASESTECDIADRLLEEAGVQGGFVVHVGVENGQLTAALRQNDSFLVQGLARSDSAIETARKTIDDAELYGPVSIDRFDGRHLPYIDNLVKLLVIDDAAELTEAEVLRVLSPGGVAIYRNLKPARKIVKPRPDDIDTWTHYMHDSTGNAVAHDQQVGPPKHLQWQCGPRWSRHHDHMASVSAMVTSGDRTFYILDEGSRYSPLLPPDWKLVARDSFSGVLLWKRSIGKWHESLFPLKSGPANLPRRLVAIDDRVYTTLGIMAPVTALDAATGAKTITFAETEGTEEILVSGNILIALVNPEPQDFDKDLAKDPLKGKTYDGRTTSFEAMDRIWAGVRSRRWSHSDRTIRAFDLKSGQQLWHIKSKVMPLSLAADASGVYYHDGEKVQAVELLSGDSRWTSAPVPIWQGMNDQGLQSWSAPTLVVQDGKVLFAGAEKLNMSYVGWGSKDIGEDTMTAFSAKNGDKLWTAPHPYSGYNSPEDLFVINGQVWTGRTSQGGGNGRYMSCNIDTGQSCLEYPPTVKAFWFHHRCHRAKATDRYILSSRTGIEFIDVKTGEWTINHWVRGGCLYGIMPANGMVYIPPNPCACYPEAKISGFAALAPATASRAISENIDPAKQLIKGPAYSKASNSKLVIDETDWPTYRGDATRSGSNKSTVSSTLNSTWSIQLTGRPTQPVVADGRLVIAEKDKHRVLAIDPKSGKPLWSFTAGGRVDSAPTLNGDRVYFGCCDGYVYCLTAEDGQLIWKFRAAPIDRRIVAFEQVESSWPISGSVLVQEDICSFVAGRSVFLDGGLRMIRLDAVSGELLSEKIFGDKDPQTGKDFQQHHSGLSMAVGLPDILSSDGEHLFMRSQMMDLEGNREIFGPSEKTAPHLFASAGFLDDSWFHRSYWTYGPAFYGGCGGYTKVGKITPSGKILAADANSVYSYGKKPQYYRWTSIHDYQLFAADKPGGDSGTPRAILFENPDSLDPKGKPITISAWVKTDASDGVILARGANVAGFALILTDRRPRMLLRADGKTHEVHAKRPIGNDWTHVAGVLTAAGNMTIYVDGLAAGTTQNVPLLPVNPIIPMKIGYEDTGQLLPKPLTPYSGMLDEVTLAYRAWTDEDIAAAADRDKQYKPTADGLVLYLPFTKDNARDASGSKHNGTIKSPTFVEGPHGRAIQLQQPKKLVTAASRQAGSSVAYRWARDIPISVKAMVLTGRTLFVAGPEDLLDEPNIIHSIRTPESIEILHQQVDALAGRNGGKLQAVDAESGEALADYTLDSPPIYDGMIAAGERIYIVTMDGKLTCFESSK